MTVVVTGASGFLGSALMPLLRGVTEVIGLSRRPLDGLTTVADYTLVRPPPEAILVHLAETSNVATASLEAASHVTKSTELCRRLLEKPWKHVVYTSSAVVYGDALASPRRPDEPVVVNGPYAEAKLACEERVQAAGGTVLRLTNVYGQGMAAGTVIPDIIAQLDGKGPVLVRDAAPVRDFLHVADAVAGIAAAIRAQPGGCLNLGSGTGISIGMLAALLLRLAGGTEREVRALQPSPGPSHLVLDVTQTRQRLGWHPEIALVAGLEMLLKSKP